MVTYEYWAHSGGEQYLIRLDAAKAITGVCGPLRLADIPQANRHNFNFDEEPQHSAWVRGHQAEFHNLDTAAAKL